MIKNAKKIYRASKFINIFFFLTELSSLSIDIPPRHPPRFPNIRYFEEVNGTLRNLGPGLELMRHEEFFYGVSINGHTYPICDGEGERVIVRISNFENIPMTPELATMFGYQNLSWNHTINQRRLLAAANRRNRQT